MVLVIFGRDCPIGPSEAGELMCLMFELYGGFESMARCLSVCLPHKMLLLCFVVSFLAMN